MVRERWKVDGYEITEGSVRDVEYRTGLYLTPAAVGDDGQVPNRTGLVWRRKKHGPGGFVLNVWLGETGPRSGFESLYDDLLRAVAQVHRQVEFERTLAGGTVRTCLGEVVSVITPDPLGSQAARMGIEVIVPAGYWQSSTTATQSTGTGAAATVALSLTNFAGTTAPMERLTYTLTGPLTNPKIVDVTDAVDGDWVTYSDVIPSGQALVLDSETWGVSGTGGLVPDLAKLSYSGSRFLTVPAARPGQTPAVRLDTTATPSGTARLTVSGRLAFLC